LRAVQGASYRVAGSAAESTRWYLFSRELAMMNARVSSRSAAGVLAAALLAACGSHSSIGVPGTMPQSHVFVTHAERGGSWMLPEAKSEDLLYVSGPHKIYVFSYPAAKAVGTLTGLNNPQGICSDRDGNVWITDHLTRGRGKIVEFAHGGSTPIAHLADPFAATACAVDPRTNNLAVANDCYSCSGILAIYPNSHGEPKLYAGPAQVPYSCAIDGAGDVFEAGFVGVYAVGVVWLPHGTSQLKYFNLRPKNYPHAGVQWDGRYLAAGSAVARIHRYIVGKNSGRGIGAIILDGGSHMLQFAIQENTLIGTVPGKVLFWKYPAGGSVVRTISSVKEPYGVAVSLAPSH